MMQKILFVLIISFCFLTSADAQRTDPGLIWQRLNTQAPSAPWIGKAVSIGNYGSQVIAGHAVSLNVSRTLSAYAQGIPVILQESTAGGLALTVKTASARTKDLQASIFSRTVNGGGESNLTLIVSSLSQASYNWTYVFPVHSDGNDNNNVIRITTDGEKLAVAYRSITGHIEVAVFNTNSATPISTFTSTETISEMNFKGMDLSASGNAMLLHGFMFLKVLSIPSMSILHSSMPMGDATRGTAISGDGAVFAVGRVNSADIYKRNASGQYIYDFSVTQAQPNFTICDNIRLSNDASIGIFTFASYQQTNIIKAINIINHSQLMSKTINTNTNSYVTSLSSSSDGHYFAVGIYSGTIGAPQVSPQLFFFRYDSSTELASYLLRGPVMSIEMSANGKQCAVGIWDYESSTTTNSNFGSIELYQVLPQDIAVHGIPHAASQIQIELKGTPGRNATVLMSHSLATNPQTYPQMGTLHVNRADISVISAGTFDAQGRATATITLPGTVGTELFFQKLETGNLQPRRLGEDFVKVQTF